MQFNNSIVISDKVVSNESKTFIIAEAGVNHNGDMELARQMIDKAVEAGVDAVKFQTFKADELILKNVDKAPYQKKTTTICEKQYDMLKRLEMKKQQIVELMEYCKKRGILFLSTPFEKKSLDELDELGVSAFKIAATDLTNIQFLRQIAQKKKPIILSAGMCYLEEVQKALEAIESINRDVILLQCTANYPIEDEEANIRIVQIFRNEFGILVGYSDHSRGVGASPYAVAMGAKVVEKHFTLDKNMEGPDHKASVTPDELVKMVKDIRRVEKYLGNGVKMPTMSEQNTRRFLQKYFVATKDIRKGELFEENNIIAMRTGGTGISAIYYDNLIGQKAEKDYRKNEVI